MKTVSRKIKTNSEIPKNNYLTTDNGLIIAFVNYFYIPNGFTIN